MLNEPGPKATEESLGSGILGIDIGEIPLPGMEGHNLPDDLTAEPGGPVWATDPDADFVSPGQVRGRNGLPLRLGEVPPGVGSRADKRAVVGVGW